MAKKKPSHLEICPRCRELKKLTKHHINPVRFFGGGGPLGYICRDCHDRLEKLIWKHETCHDQRPPEKLTKRQYALLWSLFIQNRPIR